MSATRENLIGYLLDALQPAEQAEVEAALARDAELKRQCDLLARSLRPLECDREGYAPPMGLASRCCEFVATQGKVRRPAPVAAPASRWQMSDLVVAAGVFLAATLLFWPAMNQSRFAARVRGCQNNLRQISVALDNYSAAHAGKFPSMQARHTLNRAGLYAVKLVDGKFLGEPRVVICPASELAQNPEDFELPTYEQLERRQVKLVPVLRKMGGSYGFSLGYIDKGKYQPPQDLRRSTHALMADTPSGEPDRMSHNHGRCGQNVLFEDFHVEFITGCRSRDCRDHIFENRDGQQHAGVDPDDVVVGASDATPLPVSQ